MGVLKKLTKEYFGDIVRDEDFFNSVEVHSKLKLKFKYDEDGEFYFTCYADDDEGYIIEKIDTDKVKGLAIITTSCVILIEELKNDKYIGKCFFIVDENDILDDVYDKFYTILTKINKGFNWRIDGDYMEINKQDIPYEIGEYIGRCLRLKLIKQ